jgi:hypothetical protein
MRVHVYCKQPMFTTVSGYPVRIYEKVTGETPLSLVQAADYLSDLASNAGLRDEHYILVEE